MYRPTVRMDDVFKEYIDQIHKVTSLDKNQIMRLALFTTAYSKEFLEVIKEHQKTETSLPSPSWESWDYRYWQRSQVKGGSGVNAISEERTATKEVAKSVDQRQPRTESNAKQYRCESEETRSVRKVHERTASGGISIKIG